jgi:nucleotide-binding universal stress UspA family protein
MAQQKQADGGGWINIEECEALLTKPMSFCVGIDGSDPSLLGFHYVVEGIMQKNRETSCEVVHVCDNGKDYLPVAWQPDQLRATTEAKLTSALSEKRYRVAWLHKDGMSAAAHMNERSKAIDSDFVVVGFTGRKGKKDNRATLWGSNVQELIQSVPASVIVMKDDDPAMLPRNKPVKYVVSVSLNKASTKAFLDALRLSNPGDEIHVVYVKSFMERTDSDYTASLREKYSAFFSGIKDGQSGAFRKFHDRRAEFVMVKKMKRETTAQAVVRYGDEIEADFMVVGTNTLRVQRGKKAIGSVSMDICLEWNRNFIVSHWLDVTPEVYKQYGSSPTKNREY